MNETLKALYDRFYKRPELAALNESVKANHRLLIDRLDKSERKLVLRIIDDETAIVGRSQWTLFSAGSGWRGSSRMN
jgi:hypothetical protein